MSRPLAGIVVIALGVLRFLTVAWGMRGRDGSLPPGARRTVAVTLLVVLFGVALLVFHAL